MAEQNIPSHLEGNENDQMWFQQLRAMLLPSIRSWVYTAGVAIWRGQESDIIEDILEETVIKVYTYMQQAKEGLYPPIVSMNAFSKAVARNHFQDQRRKDSR